MLRKSAVPIEVRFLALVRQFDLLPQGATVLAAVSGGADSVTLLHLLLQHAEALGIRVAAAHLNHGLRGGESEEDAEFVAALCATLGVQLRLGVADLIVAPRRNGLEAACRAARHGFLREAAAEVGASRIALGHTLDDRAETILLNLLRGTGLEGLAAMRPCQTPLVRPILEIRRAETEAYCKAHKIGFREDKSNADLGIRRNRIRSELLPVMRRYWNPSVDLALVRLGKLAASEAAYLNEQAAEWLFRCSVVAPCGGLTVDTDALSAVPEPLRRRVLRQAIQQVRGSLEDIEFETVDRLCEAVARPARTVSFTLKGEAVRVEVERGRMRLLPVCHEQSPFDVELALPGRTEVPAVGIVVEIEEAASHESCNEKEPGLTALFVARSLLCPPLRVRSRLPGDRIRPSSLGHTQKLQDIFVNRKAPRAERNRIPVFADATGPFWIPGFALDERVMKDPSDGPRYRFRIVPAPESSDVLQCSVDANATKPED